MILRYLLEKEFKQILRNKIVPKLIIGQILMMILVYPWAANQEIKQMRLSVVDNDHSTYSTRLIEKATSSGYFQISDVSQTYPEALAKLDEGKVDMIMEIQPDFERNVVRADAMPDILIATNSVNGTKGSLGSNYMQSILLDYMGDLQREEGAKIRPNVQGNATPRLSISPQYRFNPTLNYKRYMIPAMMVSLLTMLCGFLPALNIVGEKEQGTIEQINVSPVQRRTFIIAKLIPFWVIGLFAISTAMGLAYLVYGLLPVGSFLTIYLYAALYIVVVSGIGLIVSNYSDNLQQATLVVFFFMMIFLLISGMFTPIMSMPTWARYLAYLNPLSYFIDIMRSVYLRGSGVMDLLRQGGMLVVFALVLNLWAILSYKKTN